MERTTKTCPHCAEMIKVIAKKCRFCGHQFDQQEVKEKIRELQLTLEDRGTICPRCESVLDYAFDGQSYGPFCQNCKKGFRELMEAFPRSIIEEPSPSSPEISSNIRPEEILTTAKLMSEKKDNTTGESKDIKRCPTCCQSILTQTYDDNGTLTDRCAYCGTVIHSDNRLEEYQKLNSVDAGLVLFMFQCLLVVAFDLFFIFHARTPRQTIEHLVYIILPLAAVFSLIRRKRYAPFIAISYLLYSIINKVVYYITPDYTWLGLDVFWKGSIFINLIWIFYFLGSRRVRVVYYPEKFGLQPPVRSKSNNSSVDVEPVSISNISVENETKMCPACAEIIPFDTQRCPICRETFDPTIVDKEVNTRRAELEEIKQSLIAQDKVCPRCGRMLIYAFDGQSYGPFCQNCRKGFQELKQT